jgi:solute carrier family 25 oxoglutarate transporter 11
MSEGATRLGIALVAGCGASCCVHPLDVVRVNLQVDQAGARVYKGTLHCMQSIAQRQGLRGLYSGISAGMLRQLTYGGPRMALYPALVASALRPGENSLSLPKKFACGAAAGGLASLMGVPSEVALVRMTADMKLAADDPLRRNYLSVLDALRRIVHEEGISTLWEGAGPTVSRAVLINAGQLAVYSQAKETVRSRFGLEGIPLQFVSSLVASVVAVGLSCPADVLKSRMQNMRPGEYGGTLDCARKIVKFEGVLSLWKGYTPATIKLAPHTVISFIILDNLSKWLLGKEAL